MTHIHILGGSGYAGSHLVHEAARRGHQVVSYSRNRPHHPEPGVEYRTGDLTDPVVINDAFSDADVVISALSARGPLADEDTFIELIAQASTIARERNIRFGIIGGAGTLLTHAGGTRLVDTPGFPEAARPESLVMAAVLDWLQNHDDGRFDWFFVSPAANFGAQAPGEARGTYRLGGDIVLEDEEGKSEISGPDLALAVIYEVEQPKHHRQRFTIAY